MSICILLPGVETNTEAVSEENLKETYVYLVYCSTVNQKMVYLQVFLLQYYFHDEKLYGKASVHRLLIE